MRSVESQVSGPRPPEVGRFPPPAAGSEHRPQLREGLAAPNAAPLQGLLFWLFQRGLKVSFGTVGGIEAVMMLTLIILK